MKRFAIALIAGAAVSTLVYASASALTVDGGTIQAGSDTTVCDSDGVKANWGLETDTNTVNSVRISGIDTACAGADIFVSVNGEKGIAKITIPNPMPSDSVSVPFTARTPESIDNIKVWIEG